MNCYYRYSSRAQKRINSVIIAATTVASSRLGFLGPAFGRTDFSRIFIFEPPDFFADFLAGFFLLIFVGKKCLEKSSRKIPGKILQNLYNKNPPTHFCRLPRARVSSGQGEKKLLRKSGKLLGNLWIDLRWVRAASEPLFRDSDFTPDPSGVAKGLLQGRPLQLPMGQGKTKGQQLKGKIVS